MEVPTDPFQAKEPGGSKNRAPVNETPGTPDWRSSSGGAHPGTTSPNWMSVLLGRWILRFCPPARKASAECNEERCALRIYCKCARENYEYGAVLEQRVWLLLAVCGAAVILFWIFGSGRGVGS